MIIINPNADYSGLGLGRAFAPITPEVEYIMANYSGATDKMAAALSLFFASIGDTIKNKIKCAFFPLFSSDKSEALFSYVQDSQVYPQSNNADGLYFDSEKKLLQCDATSNNWNRYTFAITALFGSSATKQGSHSVLQIIPATDTLTRSFMSISYTNAGWGLSNINFGDKYHKFIGIACRNVSADGTSGTAQIFADTSNVVQNTIFASYGNNFIPFGQNAEHSDGKGSRIVIFAEGTTLEEDYVLRTAILALDNTFFA